MDSTLSGFFLPGQGGNQSGTGDAVSVPRLTTFGFRNVHYGLGSGAEIERRKALDQRKSEGATQKGEPVDNAARFNIPVLALGALALGIVVWRGAR